MATKSTCTTLQKVADDEPIFVLRAQDKSAAPTVRYWILVNPGITQAKRTEAEYCAQLMEDWPKQKDAD